MIEIYIYIFYLYIHNQIDRPGRIHQHIKNNFECQNFLVIDAVIDYKEMKRQYLILEAPCQYTYQMEHFH